MKFEIQDIGFGFMMAMVIAMTSGLLFLLGYTAYTLWTVTGPIPPIWWAIIGAFVAVWVACTVALSIDRKPSVMHHYASVESGLGKGEPK